MRISDWSSDVCSSDLPWQRRAPGPAVDFSISVGGVSQWLRPGAWPRHGPRLAPAHARLAGVTAGGRSEEHTSELQALMSLSYAVLCLKKKEHNIHIKLPMTIYRTPHTI